MNTDHQDSQSQSQDQRVSTNTCMDEGDWNTATFGGRDDNVEDSSRFNEVDSCMRGADRNSEGQSKELQFEAELQERILNDKEEVKEGSTQVSMIDRRQNTHLLQEHLAIGRERPDAAAPCQSVGSRQH